MLPFLWVHISQKKPSCDVLEDQPEEPQGSIRYPVTLHFDFPSAPAQTLHLRAGVDPSLPGQEEHCVSPDTSPALGHRGKSAHSTQTDTGAPGDPARAVTWAQPRGEERSILQGEQPPALPELSTGGV